jgi:hypothetical protein
MKSTVTFKEFFNKLYEDVTAGSALGGTSGFNPQADSINSSDAVYAPNELRVAKGSKVIQTRGKAIKIKSRRKKKK